MANLMEWRETDGFGVGAYVGVTSDGKHEVRVDGDEISEAIAYAAKADGVDMDALFESDRDAYDAAYARYRDMQLNPDDWAGLDEDGNTNVETIKL